MIGFIFGVSIGFLAIGIVTQIAEIVPAVTCTKEDQRVGAEFGALLGYIGLFLMFAVWAGGKFA